MILLDIEGTTTPIAFVTRTLVPYAREHLHAYLAESAASPHGVALLEALRLEHAGDRDAHAAVTAWPQSAPDALAKAEAYAGWLMHHDRKSPALKELQGHIWERGYRSGALVAPVFPDVEPAFRRWRGEGHALGIFSSGSVMAQQWLFRCSTAGDLTPHIQWYFDTQTGPKRDPVSYERIAGLAGEAPSAILFLSDVAAELDAARTAGMRTVLSQRPENPPQPPHDHAVAVTFDQINAPHPLPSSSAR